MIKIKLYDGDKKKVVTHTARWVSTRKLLEGLDVDGADYDTASERINAEIAFVASVFDDVTADDILDGVNADKLQKFLQDFYSQLFGGEDEGAKKAQNRSRTKN